MSHSLPLMYHKVRMTLLFSYSGTEINLVFSSFLIESLVQALYINETIVILILK